MHSKTFQNTNTNIYGPHWAPQPVNPQVPRYNLYSRVRWAIIRNRTNERCCHSSGGYPSVSHRGGPNSISGSHEQSGTGAFSCHQILQSSSEPGKGGQHTKWTLSQTTLRKVVNQKYMHLITAQQQKISVKFCLRD
jgi:hypothetical protein